jgi:hypothetical protein
MNTRRPNTGTTTQDNVVLQEIDCRRRKPELDVHTTTNTKKESDGADDIHHEGSGHRTPQNEDKCLSATTLNQKT